MGVVTYSGAGVAEFPLTEITSTIAGQPSAGLKELRAYLDGLETTPTFLEAFAPLRYAAHASAGTGKRRCTNIETGTRSGGRSTGDSCMRLGNFSVSLAVKDLGASRAFYEKLGFRAIGGDPAQH